MRSLVPGGRNITLASIFRAILGPVRRAEPKPAEDRPLRVPALKWDVIVPEGRRHWIHRVTAFTKSEARAAMKREMGIPRKGRLPVGTVARIAGMMLLILIPLPAPAQGYRTCPPGQPCQAVQVAAPFPYYGPTVAANAWQNRVSNIPNNIPSTTTADSPAAFLSLLNAERARYGRPPLAWDQDAANAASTNSGVHDPRSMYRPAGWFGYSYQCWYGGRGYVAAYYAWMASPPHRAYLMAARRGIGVAPSRLGMTADCY